ncbi:MAG TPA: hypothetical protein VLC55_12135 [Burkholderiales bacterium]|nr:hypothetical protein [Burkholderiales bacterium]
MKRIIILALAIAALSFVVAGTADAVCNQTGEIVRVQTTPGGGATTIFLRNTNISNFTWFAATTDLKIAEMAAAAVANRNRAQIVTSAAACPGIVNGANLAMGGVITTFFLFP